MRKILGVFLLFLFLDGFTPAAPAAAGNTEEAIFAGGCFWCMESDFEHLGRVDEVVSGYIGGTGEAPTYHDYAGRGFIEAVRVTYDPAKISYAELLDYFWRHVDPTDGGGQFCDRGHAYTTAVFVLTDEQQRLAGESRAAAERALGQPVVTRIVPAGTFYPAEDYHQDYYKKNPLKYKYYRFRCGRDKRVREVWGSEE